MPHEPEIMAFARNPAGDVVHISEVPVGLDCECVCLKCWGKVVARKGNIRQHHFSHYKGGEGLGCTETALHKAAKAMIQRERRLILPQQLEGLGLGVAGEASFDTVSLEHRLGLEEAGTEIIADAYGQGPIDLVIEIAVHHRVPEDKAEKIRRLGLHAVEINLANAASSLWDWGALRYAVITDPKRRSWINLPEPEPTPDQNVIGTHELPTWKFPIRGTTVVARKLPIKNVSVWHPINLGAREVVENICRGRGRWDKKHKNWIVFDYFWPEVFAKLQASSEVTK